MRVTILFVVALLGLSSCVSPDIRHRIVISIPEQRMALLEDGAPLSTYPVSTSKFGLGDFPGSSGTPLGKLEVAKKIGAHAPSGAAFKDRRRTGEIVPPDAPGRDIIVISPADCFVLFGANPTATTSCLLVPADTPIRFTNINGGEKFAVILGSSTATVQYFEAL